MLLQLGARSPGTDVNDLLVECHARIRSFLVMARQVAFTAGVPQLERRDAAAQIRRYFAQAFPLHLEDEDELLAHHLGGRDPKTDAALARMGREHVAHAVHVSSLIDACDRVVGEDERVEANDAALLTATERLTDLLLPHLLLEERELFPVLATLPGPVKEAIRARMRARREHPHRELR